MKYLGYIATHTTIPFIMNIAIVEMVARAFKKVLSSIISNLYLDSNRFIDKSEEIIEK